MKLSFFPVSNQRSTRNRSVTWMPGTRWPMLLAAGLAGALSLAGENPPPPDGLVIVAGGPYKPLYSSKASERKTEAFFLGITPVTNGEFLEFVRAHPEWRRSQVKREMADENYLKHWADDLDLGEKR
jgi:formylglycine-generating enzyme